jgi:hypothetical protein
MNLQENIRRILKEERNISDIIKIVAKEYNCSTWEINNGYCEDFALNVLEKLGGYEDNLFELSGDMFFNQRDPEFAKENWGDVIETNYGVWSKNLLDYWGYPPNVNLNLVDDEINHVWLFYNGKHYDAEVPEGVDNWFEIPLIKRLFNRYKKNMVQENIRRILREERTDPKENPVKYYYYNYLNENPIEFEGLFLVPKWTGLQIKWKVENPNDYSYSKSVLTQVLYDEFKSFCDMTNTDFNKYKHFASWMKNIRNNCYVSEEDRKRLNDNGKQIKHIDFSGIRHRYEFDFNYETTDVTTSDPEVEVYVYGNITNLIKTDLQDNSEQTLKKVNPRHFISDMTESDYDLWKEELYNILHSMYNIFVNNPRFYNNDYDYFELGLQQTP